MNRPIVLWMTPRSRSSLVSKVFINHRVWWGDTPFISEGYIAYENKDLNTLQEQYRNEHPNPVPPQSPKFLAKLAKIVPQNQQWVVKTGVEWFNCFKPLNPYNVFIRRAIEDVATSVSNKNKIPYAVARSNAEWKFNLMDEYMANGGVNVDTDKIIAGDYSQIKTAIEYCGLVYEEGNVRRAILSSETL